MSVPRILPLLVLAAVGLGIYAAVWVFARITGS
jgi:hypothetical protein